MTTKLDYYLCERCRRTISQYSAIYYRKKNPKGNPWLLFCSLHCAQKHAGKEAELYNYAEYIQGELNRVMGIRKPDL